MKSLTFSLIFVSLISLISIQAQEVKKEETKLSEVQTLKAQNLKLSIQLAQCSSQLTPIVQERQLSEMKSSLEKEYKETLKCKDGFDWNNLTCEIPKDKEEKK